MARNRQKAKERQARRKARAGQRDGTGAAPRPKPPEARKPPEAHKPPAEEAPTLPAEEAPKPRAEPEASDNGGGDEAIADAHLRAGAPPEDVGHANEVLEYEQGLDASSDEQKEVVPAEDVAEHDLIPGPRGHRASAERHAHRPRFVQFLFAVSAELQRVQWPDRQALTTLTGVVLGFVLIAGGYLGLLDAIFSRIIQAIL